MKKKINYNGIPKKVLKMVLGESYGFGDYTLKDEIDKYGEDIIAHRYFLTEKNEFGYFHAWTKNNALILIDSIFGDRIILGLYRNPPQELLKENKNGK